MSTIFKNAKKYLCLLLSLISLIFLFYLLFSNKIYIHKKIHHQLLIIEKAVTPFKQTLGLSYRQQLLPNHAMLFIFPKEQKLSFWMRGMKFPIDIIWLNKFCQIIDISAHQMPCQNSKTCPLIIPVVPAKYVLETTANFAVEQQIKIGEILHVC